MNSTPPAHRQSQPPVRGLQPAPVNLDALRFNIPLNAPLCPLILGTSFGRPLLEDPSLAHELFDTYVRLGGNCFDLAWWDHDADEVLGQWMRSRRNRSSLVIHATGAWPDTLDLSAWHGGWPGPGKAHKTLGRDLQQTLRRLGTDYLDLFTVLGDDPTQPVAPTIESLAVEQWLGHIRGFGACNWSIQRLEEANAFAHAHGLPGFVVRSQTLALAVPHRPWRPEGVGACDAQDRQWHAANRFPLFARSSLDHGFFGAVAPALPAPTALASGALPHERGNGEVLKAYHGRPHFQCRARVIQLAAQRATTAAVIALAWVLNQPMNVHAVIVPQTVAELEELFKVCSLTLTPPELDWLEQGAKAHGDALAAAPGPWPLS